MERRCGGMRRTGWEDILVGWWIRREEGRERTPSRQVAVDVVGSARISRPDVVAANTALRKKRERERAVV